MYGISYYRSGHGISFDEDLRTRPRADVQAMLSFIRTPPRTRKLPSSAFPTPARPYSAEPIRPSAPPGPAFSVFHANTQLRHLVKSDRLADARQLFDRMPHRDEISYTTLISGYVRASDPLEALSLFSSLHTDPSLSPDPFVLSLALKACSSRPSFLPLGSSLHALSLKSAALHSSVFVSTALLHMYSLTSPSDPSPALQVFCHMPLRSVVSWTAAIAALSRAGRPADALRILPEMRASGVPCDSHTFAAALTACAGAHLLLPGREIHARAAKLGLDAAPFVANSLGAMYARCGRPRAAFAALSRMRSLDVVGWTTAISTLVQLGRNRDAVEAFIRMRSAPTCVSPNDYTCAAVISACAGLARADCGEQLHAHVSKEGFAGVMSVANALVTMYSRAGNLVSADTMFREMAQRDIVSWSAVISAHSQEGHAEEALGLFNEMRSSGTRENEFALASLLSACACAAMLAPGRAVHAHALSLGLQHEAMVGSALVNMYAKCGGIDDARRVFDELDGDDIISWTAMINGYAEHGCSVEAIELFDEMHEAGLKPDNVTFIGVLTACSHAGLVDLGYRYFYSMRAIYGIEPCKEHYGCMVDLLGRAGRLWDAEKLIKDMRQPPDVVVWSALLRACQMHGETELGHMAAKRILELQPECAGTHITLSNIYAAKGRWKEAAEARKMMRAKGVKKEAGWSWVADGDGVSVFVAGDRAHPRSDEIYDILDLLASSSRAKIASHDMEVDTSRL